MKRACVCWCVFASVWLLLPIHLAAQEVSSIGEEAVEPVLTEESLPEESGECALRTSFDYHANALEPANALPRLQLFCGFAGRWGAELDLPFAYPEHEISRTGFGDVATSLKYRLNEAPASIPVIVLGVETRFPTGNPRHGTGEEGYEIQPFVALLKQRGRLGLQANVGVGFPASSEQNITMIGNFATTLRLTAKRLYVLGEANASRPYGESTALSLSPGIHYQIAPRVYGAMACPVDVLGGSRRLGLVVQMQFRFHVVGNQ